MDESAWHGLYRLLAAMKMPKPTVPCQLGGKGRHADATIAIGWPDLKMGLALETDEPGPFIKQGWWVETLPITTLSTIAPILQLLDRITYERLLRESESGTKRTTSRDEQILLEAMLRAGLPMPDRNLEIRDDTGRIVTTPDFAWADRRLIVELDGWIWHGGRDLREEILTRAAADERSANHLTEHQRDQASRDAAKRREASRQGWTVLVVSDGELADADAHARIAAEIKAAWDDPARVPPPPGVLPDPAAARPETELVVRDPQVPGGQMEMTITETPNEQSGRDADPDIVF